MEPLCRAFLCQTCIFDLMVFVIQKLRKESSKNHPVSAALWAEGAAESARTSTAFGRRAAHGPWEDTGLGGEPRRLGDIGWPCCSLSCVSCVSCRYRWSKPNKPNSFNSPSLVKMQKWQKLPKIFGRRMQSCTSVWRSCWLHVVTLC